MEKISVACVVGARPNFVKMKAIVDGLEKACSHLYPLIVHTGQHYSEAMSYTFFQQLDLPTPAINLQVGSSREGAQTAKIIDRFEAWLIECDKRPAATIVVGDVNSTLGCALAATKLKIPVIHVEAGLRTFDRTMSEEINRVVTDAVSQLCLVSEPSGAANLLREGKDQSAIRLVGNVMIDVLKRRIASARACRQAEIYGMEPGNFALWTMHRPSNVDDAETLAKMISAMERVAQRLPVVFPVHPRTRSRLETFKLWARMRGIPRVVMTPSLGYLEFLSLCCDARLTITDSGGVQEEATALEIPCLTLRENTERPITVEEGTNTLVGQDADLLEHLVDEILAQRYKKGRCPELWDGNAGLRAANEIGRFLANSIGDFCKN